MLRPHAGLLHRSSYAKASEDTPSPKLRFRMASATRSPKGGAGDEIRTHDPNLGKVVLYP